MKTANIDLVNIIMDHTASGYSRGRYGERQWRKCIESLMERGLSELQTRAVMMSKWTRWAADANLNKASAEGLLRFMDNPGNHITPEAIQKLTDETFPAGYDDEFDEDEDEFND